MNEIFDITTLKLKVNNKKQYSIKELFDIFFFKPTPDNPGKINWVNENKEKIIKFLCYSKNFKVKTKPENEKIFIDFLKELKVLIIENKIQKACELIQNCTLVKVVE